MVDVGAPALPRIDHLWSTERSTALSGVLADAYGAALDFSARTDRPLIVANFVSTLDGVVSYATPEAAAGGEISGFFGPDRFVMSLLRGLADAVLIGAGTLRAAPGDAWTPGEIYPDAGSELAELRERRGLAPQPTTVVVSASGQIDPAHPGLAAPEVPALVVTTRRGAEQMAGGGLPFDVAIAGEGTVAVERLVAMLGRRGMDVVLCEGGPHLLGQLLAADLVDELFLTVAPQIAGRSDARPRLGLVEGLAFRVTEAPWWRLVSLGRSGDHLFLRYRRERGDHEDTGVRP